MVSGSISNGDKRSRTSPGNGARSNGARTAAGLLANALAKTTHGIRAWTPVLPTELEEDWAESREGINRDWSPVSRTEQELTYCLAMAFWQRHRLYRHEKELVLRNAKEEATLSLLSYGDDDDARGHSGQSIWNGGQAALRKEIAVCETILLLLDLLANEPATTPLASDDALLLTDRILRCVLKKGEPLPKLSEPEGGWTTGAITELVAELALDCRKNPQSILATVYQDTKECLESRHYQLDQVLQEVERSSVPDQEAAKLLDYDRRHLTTAIRCIHELQRLQSLRQGLIVPPPAALGGA
jgi:hypothetical protein